MTIPELLVVMPVYNERESIHHVLSGWLAALDGSGSDYRILVINDGSTDDSLTLLEKWRNARPDRLEIRSRKNQGHGATCIEGYREALCRGIPYILQVDSDGQSVPEFFESFWRLRGDYDVIYGLRRRRDGWQRVLASRVLRTLLRWIEGVDCVDANVPYRLMRGSACAPAIARVPQGVSLANIALAVMLRRSGAIRHGTVKIDFPARLGGEPSVPTSRFLIKAVELFRQLREMRENNSESA